jgi:hypothetical protein
MDARGRATQGAIADAGTASFGFDAVRFVPLTTSYPLKGEEVKELLLSFVQLRIVTNRFKRYLLIKRSVDRAVATQILAGRSPLPLFPLRAMEITGSKRLRHPRSVRLPQTGSDPVPATLP